MSIPYYSTRVKNGLANAKYWGIKPNIADDQSTLITKAINDCNGFVGGIFFPAGTYNIKKGVNIRRGAVGSPSEFWHLDIVGEGHSFDAGLGGGTKFNILNKDQFGFNVQRGKGVRFIGLEIAGQNHLPYTLWDVLMPYSGKTFVENGCSDHRLKPYCGVGIDLIGTNNTAPVDRYREFEDLYTEQGSGGGTDIQFIGCNIYGFTVNICISPNATLLNAECISGQDNWFGSAKVAISVGNHQTRTCDFARTKCWSAIETFMDGQRYGMGASVMPSLSGTTNLAGGQRFAFRYPEWFSYHDINGLYSELLGSYAGCQTARVVDAALNNCRYYAPPQHYTQQGLIKLHNPIMQADNISMNDCWFIDYGNVARQFNFSANSFVARSTRFTNPPIVHDSNMVKFDMCHMDSSGKLFDDVHNPIKFENTSGGAVLITKIDEQNNEWAYEIDNSLSLVKTGDFVQIWNSNLKGMFNYTTPSMIGAGNVKSINGKQVTVSGIPMQITNGQKVDAYTSRIKTS